VVVQRSYLLVLWVQVPPLQFSVGNVVIPDSSWSDPMAESSEGLQTSQDDPRMTKTVPITEEGNGKEVCRLAD
jgi:hypothetical protein